MSPNTQERAIEVADRVRQALELFGADALRMLEPEPTPPERCPTVAAYAERFLEELESRNLRPKSRLAIAWGLSKFAPAFPSLQLDEVNYSKLKPWVIGLSKTLCGESVKKAVGATRKLFQEAVREGLIPANPVRDLGQFYPARKRKEKIFPFTLDELAIVLDAVARWRPHYYPFILFLSDTGCRMGEAIGAQVSDIDWRKRTIFVQRNVPMVGDVEEPKSPSGTRHVDLSERLITCLEDMLRRRKEAFLGQGKAEIPEWLFLSEKGHQVIATNFHFKVWKPVMRKTGLAYRTPHDLRHTWASQLLAMGEDPAYVSTQLGHKNVAITLKLYAHWIPGRRRIGVDGLAGNAKRREEKA